MFHYHNYHQTIAPVDQVNVTRGKRFIYPEIQHKQVLTNSNHVVFWGSSGVRARSKSPVNLLPKSQQPRRYRGPSPPAHLRVDRRPSRSRPISRSSRGPPPPQK